MLSVDTNVVVRLLVNDEPRQAEQARRQFESREIWIGVTVLLEAAWVLESVYGLSTAATAEALRGVLGLPNVRTEDAAAVTAALDVAAAGVDFADALHVLRSPGDAEFATFDRAFAKSGRRLRPIRLI